jgi:hypothetical protein
MIPEINPDHRLALRGHRFLLLFLFLLATLLFYPYAEATHFGYYAFRVTSSIAILMSVYAARIHRSLLIIAVLLAIPAIFQRTLIPRSDASAFAVANNVLSFAFDVVIVVVIFRRVFGGEKPNAETIFGAVCVYLMVGFSFAGVYGTISALQPDAFYLDPHTNLHVSPNRFDFIYYSFGTITSLGAAGIVPVSSEARSVSIVEAILGVLYLAVLISRLMGAYRSTSSV